MKMPKIEIDSAFGMILTFLSVATLIILAVGGIALVIYGAFVMGSALMMGVIVMTALALPIMWLSKLQ